MEWLLLRIFLQISWIAQVVFVLLHFRLVLPHLAGARSHIAGVEYWARVREDHGKCGDDDHPVTGSVHSRGARRSEDLNGLCEWNNRDTYVPSSATNRPWFLSDLL